MANAELERGQDLLEEDRTYILAMVQNLIHRRKLVTVTFADSATQYTSTILNIDSNDGLLLMDDIFPDDGRKLLERHGTLQLRAYMSSGEMEFQCRLHSIQKENDLIYFNLHLPDKVDYMQRRVSHRIVVAGLRIQAEIRNEERVLHRARLYDISTSGASFLTPIHDEVREADAYTCVIHFPVEALFSCTIQLLGERGIGKGIGIIRGNFVIKDVQQKQILQHAIADLERRLLRLRREPQTTQTQ